VKARLANSPFLTCTWSISASSSMKLPVPAAAGLVHLVVNHGAAALDDQLGVLPADLDNIGVRVDIRGGSRLRGYFVLIRSAPMKLPTR